MTKGSQFRKDPSKPFIHKTAGKWKPWRVYLHNYRYSASDTYEEAVASVADYYADLKKVHEVCTRIYEGSHSWIIEQPPHDSTGTMKLRFDL